MRKARIAGLFALLLLGLASPSHPLPAAPAQDGWYTVILASETTRPAAERTVKRASEAGLEVGLLWSSDFPSLRPGFWVVYTGQFTRKQEADRAVGGIRGMGFPTAYVRLISEPPPDPPDEASTEYTLPAEGWFTVVLASVTSEASARQLAAQAAGRGIEPGLLWSSDFRSLRPGYWVVYAGKFITKAEADQEQARLRRLGFPTAYARFVAP